MADNPMITTGMKEEQAPFSSKIPIKRRPAISLKDDNRESGEQNTAEESAYDSDGRDEPSVKRNKPEDSPLATSNATSPVFFEKPLNVSYKVSAHCRVGAIFDESLIRQIPAYASLPYPDQLTRIVQDMICCSRRPEEVFKAIKVAASGEPFTIVTFCNRDEGKFQCKSIPVVKSINSAQAWLSRFLQSLGCCMKLFIPDFISKDFVCKDCLDCNRGNEEAGKGTNTEKEKEKKEEVLLAKMQKMEEELKKKDSELLRQEGELIQFRQQKLDDEKHRRDEEKKKKKEAERKLKEEEERKVEEEKQNMKEAKEKERKRKIDEWKKDEEEKKKMFIKKMAEDVQADEKNWQREREEKILKEQRARNDKNVMRAMSPADKEKYLEKRRNEEYFKLWRRRDEEKRERQKRHEKKLLYQIINERDAIHKREWYNNVNSVFLTLFKIPENRTELRPDLENTIASKSPGVSFENYVIVKVFFEGEKEMWQLGNEEPMDSSVLKNIKTRRCSGILEDVNINGTMLELWLSILMHCPDCLILHSEQAIRVLRNVRNLVSGEESKWTREIEAFEKPKIYDNIHAFFLHHFPQGRNIIRPDLGNPVVSNCPALGSMEKIKAKVFNSTNGNEENWQLGHEKPMKASILVNITTHRCGNGHRAIYNSCSMLKLWNELLLRCPNCITYYSLRRALDEIKNYIQTECSKT